MPLVCAYAISAGMWEMWARGLYQIWAICPREPLTEPTVFLGAFADAASDPITTPRGAVSVTS
jgi:hypothetical protein